MTVAAILREKGRDVLTVQTKTSLRDVVLLMTVRGVGAVVVSNDARAVLGILSERDVMRALAREGAGVLEAPVQQFMTERVYCATEDTTVDEVMTRMTAGRFRHVPVVEDERLVGIVSIGDVVKREIDQLAHESEDLKSYITADRTAGA